MKQAVIFSIITPSYNNSQMISHAVESVLQQNYSHFEHIIVDGGSTDNTLKVLSQYSHLRIISGPDKGMYDALNKGIEISNGDLIGFLNTDDLYAPGVFWDVANLVERDAHAIAGEAIVYKEKANGEQEILDQYFPGKASLLEYSTTIGNYFNSWFFHRSVFDRIGCFNKDYKIAGDRDFMLRYAFSGLEYVVLNKLVYKYRAHDQSLTFNKTGKYQNRSADECIALTAFYIKRNDISVEARRMLTDFHTQVALETALRYVRALAPRGALHYFWESAKYDWFWLYKLIRRIATVLLGALQQAIW